MDTPGTSQALDKNADNEIQIDDMGHEFVSICIENSFGFKHNSFLIQFKMIFLCHLQDYFGYAVSDAADEMDDSGCYAELPLEVVLHENDQPKTPSNKRSAKKSSACGQSNQASTSGHQEMSWNCDICKKSFTEWYSLNAHKMSIHHGMTYDCRNCKKSFNDLPALVRHQNTVHPKATYPCTLCGKSFRKMSALKAHIVLSHQQMHHACAECGESFETAIELKEHMAKHKANRAYICDKCQRSFTILSNLKRHKKTIHCQKWY